MRSFLGFLIVAAIKVFSHLFYRLELIWRSAPPPGNWEGIRLVVLLNHTSLYEPLYSQAFPWPFVWRFVHKMAAPGADITLQRPLVGFFWKLMVPHITPISRRRDDTWSEFMDHIQSDSLIVIAPEGRMKRPSGLDKDGKPMTVKGGIADILARLDSGLMLIGRSGGLHHVQSPGQTLPKLFRTIRLEMDVVDIAEYKKRMPRDPREFKVAVVMDMQARLEAKPALS